MTKDLELKLNELISDEASCSSERCRCWQAVEFIRKIREWADREIQKSPYDELKLQQLLETTNGR